MTTRFLLALLLALTAAPFAAADEYSDYGAKVAALNRQSISLLGVSLNAFRVLVTTKEDVYRPLAQLQQTGEYAYIQELENAGLVKVVQRDGLPNGFDRGNAYVALSLRTGGSEVQAAALALPATSGTPAP